jgi:SET domain-containing protein
MGKTLRQRSSLQRIRADATQIRQVLQWVETRRSKIHGRGLFARRDIPAGIQVIQYVGRTISKDQAAGLCQQQNRYIFTLNDRTDIDGKVSWNPARLINHSCEPNCDAEMDDRDRIWIISRRPIRRGEEITYNYGYDLEDFMNYPCRCGAATCLGYMVAEELFPTVRRILTSSQSG